MSRSSPLVHAAVFFVLGAAGCGDDDVPAADAGTTTMDAAPDGGATTCPSSTPFAPGDATGHAMPLGASATEARAGRLAAADLPVDTTGLATYAAGDFVLANDRIGVIIEDVGESDIYDPWGGKIVGLAKVVGGRLVEPADFEEAIVGIGRFTVRTASVGVLRDGSDGGDAVVRAVGDFAPLPPIDDFARALIPQSYDGVRVAIDYVLAPASEEVRVRMTFEVPFPGTLRIPLVLHGFIQPNRMPSFSPNVGFAIPSGPIPYIGFIRDDGVGYAWWSADGPLLNLFEDTGLNALSSAAIRIDGCMHVEREMARIVVGGSGMDGLLEAVARVEGTALRAIAGRVVDDAGAPAAGVRVHATLADGSYVTHALTSISGDFSLHVPATVAVQLTGFRRGDAVAGPVDVTATATTAMLALPPAGSIHVSIHGSLSTAPVPARVQVTPLDGNPTVPDSFGEVQPGDGRIHVVFPTTGDVTLRVPVGRHRVVVSHGFEDEIVVREVAVAAGETVEVDAPLEHVIDTTGVLCGDFHIHSVRSLDSSDPVRMKVESGVADGVEILVRSEHEWVADFQPVIEDLGLTAWAFGVPSDELSTTTLGHFGVVPLVPDVTRANWGAPAWAGMLLPDVFDAVRGRPESPALIVNHPRSNLKGYFAGVGYDAATGMVARPTQWDDSFTLIEVFNGSSFRQSGEEVVDWFSFLAQGRRVFAVGSSDSHRVATVPIGYPRTCLRFGHDDPRMLTANAVRDALNAGTSFVSGGIYLDARELTTGAQPGGDATGVGERAMVHVRVQAASWVDVDRLRVIVDGTETEVITIDPSTADPTRPTTRLDADVMVPVSASTLGSWVIFVAEGDDRLSPVQPGDEPFAVSNPIFLRR